MRATGRILACMLLLGIAKATYADQVILKNGDIISGKVVTKSGDTLTVNTFYAGDIKINWKEISTLTTDAPVATLLNDDSYFSTSLLPAERGAVRLTGKELAVEDEDGAAKEVATDTANETKALENKAYGLNDILYINPTPEESGRGYRYSGRANLAFTNTSGNSSNEMLHMDAEIQKRAKAYRYTLGGEVNRAKDNDVSSVSNRRVYGSYDSFYTTTDFLYVHGALENDRFKDVKLRSVIGAGYGYQVYESETTKLSLKGGPDLVSVDRYAAASEFFAALGWHVDFTHKLTYFQNYPIEIFHVQDGYRGLNSEGDVLLKTRTGLRLPLRHGFVATAQYNFDWESNPAPERGNSDRQLILGLGYTFQ
jgi:putative salt-induced outer membrane protein YdiY